MRKKDYYKQFQTLGQRYRQLRHKRNMVQEDSIEYGFSVRHYQQLEAGRPHSISTLLRISEMFDVTPESLLKGLPYSGVDSPKPPAHRKPSRHGRKKSAG